MKLKPTLNYKFVFDHYNHMAYIWKEDTTLFIIDFGPLYEFFFLKLPSRSLEIPKLWVFNFVRSYIFHMNSNKKLPITKL